MHIYICAYVYVCMYVCVCVCECVNICLHMTICKELLKVHRPMNAVFNNGDILVKRLEDSVRAHMFRISDLTMIMRRLRNSENIVLCKWKINRKIKLSNINI